MKLNFKNKKGQFESVILAIVILFVIGIILLFFNKLNNSLYDGFDEYFEKSDKFNNSVAQEAVQEIQSTENSTYDYVFLAIFIGYLIQMILLSFATRIHIAFFWLYGLLGIVGLIIGTIVSNIWQEMAGNGSFTTELTRFPITNALLGTYYPIVITAIILLVIIVTFGKTPDQGGFG